MKPGAIEKELKKIEKKEMQMYSRAENKEIPLWKEKLEEKIPYRVIAGLRKMFAKAFSLIFEKGTIIIEKTYNKEETEKDFQIRDFAVDLKGSRREFQKLKRDAIKGNAVSMLFTTAEGIILGSLGIGLPDIVIWVGTLLRGVYETALKYGFDYESPEEKMFILKILEAAMSTGERWARLNLEIDSCIEQGRYNTPEEDEIKQQIADTSDAFATDMLVVKFIQGMPVVGILGGVMNPVYYNRIMSYVQIKYRKRYLIWKKKNM